MSSTSETGHAKNVATFEILISFCTGYGIKYNPLKVALKLPALNALKTSAGNSITTVTTSSTLFLNATNAREIAFNPLKKLATKMVNSFSATDATPQAVAAAKKQSQPPLRQPPHPQTPQSPSPNKAMTAS